jgi:hypothetical protein
MSQLPPAFESALTSGGGTNRRLKPKFIFQIGGLPSAFAYSPDPIDLDDFWDEPDSRAFTKPFALKPFIKIDPTTGYPSQLSLSGSELDILEGRADMGTLNIELVDIDGELTELQGIRRKNDQRRLKVSIGKWKTTIEVDDAFGLGPAPGEVSVIYINQETLKITGKSGNILTVVRGWYRSVPGHHDGDDKYGLGHGSVITTYPRSINERPVWLWYGFDTDKLSNCVLLFSGEIRDYANGGVDATVALKCEDGQARLKKPLFWNMFEGWYDNPSIRGNNHPSFEIRPWSATAMMVDYNNPNSESYFIYNLPENFKHTQSGTQFTAVVGSYLMRFEVATVALGELAWGFGNLLVWMRAQEYSWSRSWLREWREAHRGMPAQTLESSVYPVVLISARRSIPGQTTLEDDLPWLWDYDGGAIDGYHPLLYLLQILTSTGAASAPPDVPRNGDFDTLPESWGLGIPEEEVDMDGILALARRTPDLAMRLVVTEVVQDARDWLTKQFLQPFGFYLTLDANGRVSVGTLVPPTSMDLSSAPSIGVNDLVIDPATHQFKQLRGPICEGQSRVASIRFKDTPRIKSGKVVTLLERTITVAEKSESAAFSRSADPIEIEAFGMSSLPDLPLRQSMIIPEEEHRAWFKKEMPTTEEYQNWWTAFQPIKQTGVSYIARLLELYQSRFARPSHKISVKVRPSLWALSLGDFAKVTLPNLANPFTGGRGWSNVLCEVTKRNVDPMTGDIDLELNAYDIAANTTRLLAPSLKVTAWDSDHLVLTVEGNDFSLSPFRDSDSFAIGFPVRIYSSDRMQRTSVVEILSKPDANTITLSATPLMEPSGRPPQTGDIVLFADYSEVLQSMKERWAFRTNPGKLLGNVDPPHNYG